MSYTMNSKIVSARKGDDNARKEIQARLKVALLECLDSHISGSADRVSRDYINSQEASKETAVNQSANKDNVYPNRPELRLNASRMPVSALVNRLGRQFLDRNSSWADKIDFYRLVAEMMRHSLRDFIGFNSVNKREPQANENAFFDFSMWDNCVQSLANKDKRLALILELYYMGGMSYEGIASALSLSIADVDKKLRFARAWVCRGILTETQ